MNISLVLGLKNNLDYTKNFYNTTRKLYPSLELCFASYGSTDGTHEWMNEIQNKDINVKCWYSENPATFSDTFNKASELATNDYIAYLHNDIILGKNFIENLEKHLNVDTILSYTTIEPPIFAGHERPGKIIRDLGTDISNFNYTLFEQLVDTKQLEYSNKTEPGISFFMCMHKDIFLKTGGLHNIFNPMFCEDDDLILRFKMLGLNMITSLDSICYHFVSKTSRFSDEYQHRTRQIEFNSNKNFIRKWGFRHSIHNKKYNVAFVIDNATLESIKVLEPWCDRLYADKIFNYIDLEQPNTSFDLSKRVFYIKDNDPELENDIVVSFDASKLTQESFNIIQNLSDIITESGEPGEFELGIFNIKITSLISYEKDLIYLK